MIIEHSKSKIVLIFITLTLVMQITWSVVAGLHLQPVAANHSMTVFSKCAKTTSFAVSSSNTCDQAGYFFLSQRGSLSLWWEQAIVLFPTIKIIAYLTPIFPIDKPPKRF